MFGIKSFFGIKFFKGAGATGNVFFLKSGTPDDKGIAYSGLVGPKTTIAVVPTSPQNFSFSLRAVTKDLQRITISGGVIAILTPARAVKSFDFTVDENGMYKEDFDSKLLSIITEQILNPLREKVADLDVVAVIKSHKVLAEAITTMDKTALEEQGIVIKNCSIASINADDSKIGEAIGAKEKEDLLTTADKAKHDRHMESIENDLKAKEAEAKNALLLEEKKSQLIVEENKNLEARANGKKTAGEIELSIYDKSEPGKLLGIALLEMGRNGKIGTLNVGPELLTAIQSQAR